MKASFSRVVVYVANPIPCAEFYIKHLGLTKGAWTETWAEVSSGGVKIGFHQAYGPDGPIRTATGSRDHPHKLSFQMDDVVQARQELLAQGVPMGEIKRYGELTLCDGVDIEGHVFQICNQ